MGQPVLTSTIAFRLVTTPTRSPPPMRATTSKPRPSNRSSSAEVPQQRVRVKASSSFSQPDLSGVTSNHHLRSGITSTSSEREQQEGGVKRGLPDHEAKDLGGEAPTGFDNKSNGI